MTQQLFRTRDAPAPPMMFPPNLSGTCGISAAREGHSVAPEQTACCWRRDAMPAVALMRPAARAMLGARALRVDPAHVHASA